MNEVMETQSEPAFHSAVDQDLRRERDEALAALGAAQAEVEKLRRFRHIDSLIMTARLMIEEQAEDEGLWLMAETAPEEYLQKALRRLHTVIEAAVAFADEQL